jgi:membrane-associated protein
MNFSFINVDSLINTAGLLGVFFVLFIETGLPLVVGLPGDSLLFSAGLATTAALGKVIHINFMWLVIGSPIAAIAGSQLGFWLGGKYGVKLFQKEHSKYFSPANLVKLEGWMGKYGYGKMIFLGRFVPVVRHLVNLAAGMLEMRLRNFLFWNIFSSIIWTEFFIFFGKLIGDKIPNPEKKITYIVGAIVVLSVMPIFWEIRKARRERAAK